MWSCNGPNTQHEQTKKIAKFKALEESLNQAVLNYVEYLTLYDYEC